MLTLHLRKVRDSRWQGLLHTFFVTCIRVRFALNNYSYFEQGRIHDCSCRGRLGRGGNDLGRGSNDLGRGSNDLGRGMLNYKLFNP